MPIDRLYGMVMGVRNRLFDRGSLESFDLGARTISVGNITTGGTGKTPLVASIADLLARQGEKVCILTRGYGRRAPRTRVLVSDFASIRANVRDSGDEPFELAQKLAGTAMVIADADRVAAAEWARSKFSVSAFVLDDGFQHRRAKRDLDIVCIDATDPFGGGRLLPFGRLREPLSGLVRADIILITRCEIGTAGEEIIDTVSKYNQKAAIFTSQNRIALIHEIGGRRAEPKRPFAFCGIGNSGSFIEDLRLFGASVVGSKAFRDHHVYSRSDIHEVERSASAAGADALVTTAKDAVKLSEMRFTIPCFVAPSEIVISDVDRFNALICPF